MSGFLCLMVGVITYPLIKSPVNRISTYVVSGMSASSFSLAAGILNLNWSLKYACPEWLPCPRPNGF